MVTNNTINSDVRRKWRNKKQIVLQVAMVRMRIILFQMPRHNNKMETNHSLAEVKVYLKRQDTAENL